MTHSSAPIPVPPQGGGAHVPPAPADDMAQRLRALEAREAYLRFAARAGRLGLWELDLDTLELTSSEVCRENFGRAPDEPLSYAQVLAAVHPDDAARMQAAVDHTIATGEEYAIDYRVVFPDGRIRWVNVRAQRWTDAQGRPIRMAGTSHDITEQVIVERRIQAMLQLDDSFRLLEDPADMAYEASRLLGEALDVGRAGYGDIDAGTRTLHIARDWTAPGIRSAQGPHHLPDYGSFVEDLLRGHIVVIADTATHESTAPHPEPMAAVQTRALVNLPLIEGGRLVAMLFINHPVPRVWTPPELAFIRAVAHRTRMAVQRRLAERQLRALADTLESKVEARTRELMATEEALRQAQKMEAVGQLTGGIAHDFNNLLAGIIASLDLLRLRAGQQRYDELGRYIDTAHRSAKRAAALTHRLLAFSRRQTLAPRVVDLNQLVLGMHELVQRTVGPGIDVVFGATPGLWAVRADAGQIENSLLNLCINARDAMPHGGTLRILAANHHLDGARPQACGVRAGDYVALAVADTGAGMPAEVAARAFEPFFTTKPIGQGTGLGLSMVYGFARQSGGSASIASAEGEGTTITLWLPRHDGPVPADGAAPGEEAPPPPLVPGAPPAGARGAAPCILVVDDEPAVRAMVADALREHGYEVVEAADGPAALEALRADGPLDLLLTDVGLPGGMNGRQVADAGRVLRPGLPVLFITGYAEQAVIGERDLEPGMGVLTKPFDLGALAARVASALVGARA
ncbi:response regulator [Paracidovorax anthurii]|nr:response regulator [Paracidovorax anthurii]